MRLPSSNADGLTCSHSQVDTAQFRRFVQADLKQQVVTRDIDMIFAAIDTAHRGFIDVSQFSNFIVSGFEGTREEKLPSVSPNAMCLFAKERWARSRLGVLTRRDRDALTGSLNALDK